MFGSIKITDYIKIKLRSSLTLYLAFRIFESIRHHSISGAFKNMCFRKGRRCYRKTFFLHIKFSCSDNITVRNNKAKFCKELHLNRCSEGLNTGVPSIFLQGGLKSDTMDFYIKHEL